MHTHTINAKKFVSFKGPVEIHKARTKNTFEFNKQYNE